MKFFPKKEVFTESLCDTVVLGGEAGDGIKSAGKIISASLLEDGFDAFLYDEYPSLIRGGHNAVFITYSAYPVYSVNREIDILVCIDKNTFLEHRTNLNKNSVVIYDPSVFTISESELSGLNAKLIAVNLYEIHSKERFPKIILNTLFVGATLNILGISKEIAEKIYIKTLSKKKDLLDDNIKALNLAYQHTYDSAGLKRYKQFKKRKKSKSSSYFMSGNTAAGIGAIHAGLGFYSAYPMTPSSTILDFMSKHFREYNLIVKQTEDEIAAINFAIGASFAGLRSMVGTSGGGFSLMVEALGLAAITETPLVILLAQRPGPATGLPTWTGQGDLQFALHAAQDEFPRVILTPTDAEECLDLTFKAFDIADKFQLPVIILSDKFLAESYYKFQYKPKYKKIERGLMLSDRALMRLDNFNRYEFTASGVSPRSIPGQENGIFNANSDESDEKGFSEESAINRKKKVEKRFRKLAHISKDLPELNVYGDVRAKICIITWGSTKGPALEATRRLQNLSIPVKLLALNYIEPFPEEEVVKFIKSSKKVLLVEGNFTSQLGQLITQHTGYNIKSKLLKYDGRPVYPDEIVNAVKNMN